MMNVIVIDDSEIFRTGIVSYLENIGDLTTITDMAYSEEQIFNAINSSTDIVIIDFEHQSDYGLELIRRLKRDFNKINLIIFTHERNERLKLLSERYGADYFLTKEHQHQNLWKIVENININLRGKYD